MVVHFKIQRPRPCPPISYHPNTPYLYRGITHPVMLHQVLFSLVPDMKHLTGTRLKMIMGTTPKCNTRPIFNAHHSNKVGMWRINQDRPCNVVCRRTAQIQIIAETLDTRLNRVSATMKCTVWYNLHRRVFHPASSCHQLHQQSIIIVRVSKDLHQDRKSVV